MERSCVKKKNKNLKKKIYKKVLLFQILHYNRSINVNIKKCKGLFCHSQNTDNIMKFLKNLIGWLIGLILSLGIIPAYPVAMFYIFIGIPYYVGIYFNIPEEKTIFLYYLPTKNFEINLLLAIILTIYLFYFVFKIRIPLVAFRKNAWCELCISYEDMFHLEHKSRVTGTEWKKLKYKQISDNKKRKEEAQQSWQQQQAYRNTNQQSYDYYQEQQERQEYEQFKQWQNNQQNSDQYNNPNQAATDNEVQKALAAYMFDDFDFTLEELKKTRNKLIKSFHSDNGEDNEAFAQKINRYYDVLKPYAS